MPAELARTRQLSRGLPGDRPWDRSFLGKLRAVACGWFFQRCGHEAPFLPPPTSAERYAMTTLRIALFANLLLAGSGIAQSPNLMVSFSQLERTASASGGSGLLSDAHAPWVLMAPALLHREAQAASSSQSFSASSSPLQLFEPPLGP